MAGQFDQASDRVSRASAPDPAAGLSFCAWVRVDTDRDAFSTIMRMHANTGGSTTITIANGSDGLTPRVFSPSNTTGAVSSTAMTEDVWSFVAYSYNPTGNALTLYVSHNGEALASFSATVPPGTTPTGLTLAGRSDGDSDEWLAGTLAYVRFWSGNLLEAIDFAAEMQSAEPVDAAGLWAHWPLDTDLADTSGNGRDLTAGTTAVTFVEGPPVDDGGTIDATATGSMGGNGAATGQREIRATLSGSVGGAGSASAVREVIATMTGSLGGVGAATGENPDAPEPVPAQPTGGSWGSMLSILDMARADAEEEASKIPEAHWCGEPWTTGPGGVLFCRWDGAAYHG